MRAALPLQNLIGNGEVKIKINGFGFTLGVIHLYAKKRTPWRKMVNGLVKVIRILIVGRVIDSDTPSTLLGNDVPTYCISLKCGAVKITGTTLVNDRISINFTGEFIVDVDSLKIRANNVSVENESD